MSKSPARDITLIMAIGPKGELGKGGTLPWPRHTEDMRRFQAHTLGHTIIMGRVTWESLGGPLRYRHNIVITSQPQDISKGLATAVSSFSDALKVADAGEVFVMGGSKTYQKSLLHANRLLVTQMHHHFDADTYYKVPFIEDWQEVTREEYRNGNAMADCDFIEYRRKVAQQPFGFTAASLATV